MHLDLGLSQTIKRATHVTRGFRRIVMVTASGNDRPNRLVTDLADEFSRRGIEVSQLPVDGSQDITATSALPAPARKVFKNWSHRRHEKARQDLKDSLDHQSAIIVTDPRRLDEFADLQDAGRTDRPVVVLLATDPDTALDELPPLVDLVVTPNPPTARWEGLSVPVHSIGVPAAGGSPAPGERPKRVVLLGPCTDEELSDALTTFDRACQVVPGWSLEVCLDDETRAHGVVAARRDVGIHPAGSENIIMNQSELALVLTREEDLASRILDAAGAGLPAVAYADTPAAADILARCGYPATTTDELASALSQGMADAPLRRIQRESVAQVVSDHDSSKIGHAWLDLMFNVQRSRR
ncbi:glycosyltransferase family 1 protein [Cutibacterium equinum]|uniref:Glycosyltransferase family 1 protein n=1 Tax=Cutibacterium equinum TaxID=3016342 RepID=A0ABY7QYJ3_9ACTN|nr:glycosyltransferase family 1 protein [Cutibacterium equinum]WCC80113.1 glycosyltransferase family 1 protein [Cutibacterium equinum]